MSPTLVCKDCSWVHFSVDPAHIWDWTKQWAQFCKEWPEDELSNFGIKDRQPPSPTIYYECFRCAGSYKNMRDPEPNDKELMGCTLQPILHYSFNLEECPK